MAGSVGWSLFAEGSAIKGVGDGVEMVVVCEWCRVKVLRVVLRWLLFAKGSAVRGLGGRMGRQVSELSARGIRCGGGWIDLKSCVRSCYLTSRKRLTEGCVRFPRLGLARPST